LFVPSNGSAGVDLNKITGHFKFPQNGNAADRASSALMAHNYGEYAMRISCIIVATAALVVGSPAFAQSSTVGAGSISVTAVGSTGSTSCSGSRCSATAGGGALGGGVAQSSASLDSNHSGTTTTTSAGSLGGAVQGGGSSTSGRGGTASQSSGAGGVYGAGGVATYSSHR
jgi:hypothetical protein